MMGTRRALLSLGIGGAGHKEAPEIHVVLLGELGVGKSAMTVKFITKRFIMEYDPTLGKAHRIYPDKLSDLPDDSLSLTPTEDTYSKLETLDGQDVCIKIMDTYDQEDSSPDRYLKWAHGYIVVYSITARGSFDRARVYLDSLAQYHKSHGREPPVALVGNKVDLERYRTVSKTSGEGLSAEFDCTSFHETSAAEDFDSVERVFHSLIRDITRSSAHQIALQPLIISEDGKHLAAGGTGSALATGGRTNIRRVKSPKGGAATGGGSGSSDASSGNHGNKKTDDKDQKSVGNRRPGVGLRLFKVNKSFKIFN